MKIKSIKLVNYIGIFNGLGLNEIFIDFNRCIHKTVVIKGKNASGKSTLFKALHPLPDPNSSLIPGLPAEKNIVISDNDIIYNIIIKHGVKDDGKRETTKAYIEKQSAMGREQLNPNGNVSSFKEILYSEFNLDANFVALTQLSGDDRGLADRTPVERKKFVNSIIDSVAVYNDIHKSLTKRSSVFKSIMNNLTSKIDNIGDREKLTLTLTSLENRLNNLFNDKDNIIQELASYKSKIKLLDPDSSIQNTYDMIYNELVRVNNELESLNSKIGISLNKLNISESVSVDEIMKRYIEIKDTVTVLETTVNIAEAEINNLLTKREDEARTLQNKTSKLLSLQSEGNFSDIKTNIDSCKSNIENYNKILSNIGIQDIYSISKDEFILGLNTIKDIKESIDSFKSGMDYVITMKAIDYINNDSYPDVEGLEKRLSDINNELIFTNSEISKYNQLKELASNLNMRPSNCNIDNCSFIEDSIKASLSEPEKNLEILENKVYELNNELQNLTVMRQEYSSIIECVNYLKSLYRNIERNSIILNKLPIANIFSDRNTIFYNILNGYSYNEIDTLYQFIDYSNIIDEYKIEMDKLKTLESDYKVYESKSNIIDEIVNDIESLNKKLDEISLQIESNSNSIKEDKVKISNFKNMILELDVLISIMNERKNLEAAKFDLGSRFNNIKSSIVEIKNCISNINTLESKLKNIEDQITPILNDRDKIKHGLVLLEEYTEELKIYNLKYEKVETIKKYSSPSKGIQTLFIELYMNKTLTLANQLLSLLFEGEYVLGQFVINESEFRIPCIGSGLANDDITSMSTSQVCMISMILSFVMLQQASTKYNILKLDEIDGGLDTKNRLQFLHVLEQLQNMLSVEQCIMISHNTEMDLSNCDIIQLKLNEGEEINGGNVIFKY